MKKKVSLRQWTQIDRIFDGFVAWKEWSRRLFRGLLSVVDVAPPRQIVAPRLRPTFETMEQRLVMSTFQMVQTAVSRNENAGTATIEVKRDTTAGQANVAIFVQNVTTNSADYSTSGNPVSLYFADGQMTATMSVTIVDDLYGEGAESLTLSLISPSEGYDVDAAFSLTTLTIIDDDPFKFSFASSTATVTEASGIATLILYRDTSLGTASVNYQTSSGSASSGSDYTPTFGTATFAAGSTSTLITIPILEDSSVESAESFTIVLSEPSSGYVVDSNLGTATVVISDNDTGNVTDSIRFGSSMYSVLEGAGAVTMTLERTTASGSASVYYQTWDGTATQGTDYSYQWNMATFADGMLTALISIPLVGDATPETPTTEYFTVVLSNPSSGYAIHGSLGSATVAIVDDDAAPSPKIRFSSSTASVQENSGSIALTLYRDNSLGTASVQYQTSDGSAYSMSDYSYSSGVATFADGSFTTTIVVPLTDDSNPESNETFQVFLSAASDGYSIDASLGTATVTIVDNDPVVSNPPVAVDDGVYSVLHGQSLYDINVRANDTNAGSASVAIETYPMYGSVWVNGSGNVSYSAPSNYAGPVSFTYRLWNSSGSSNVATVAINVTNQSPTAASFGPVSVIHGRSKEINLRSLVADGDGDYLSISVVSQPVHGYLSYNSYSDRWTYSPYGNYVGADSFAFKANDGVADSNVATVTLNVTNQAPVAVDDGVYLVHHGQSLSNIDLKANDSDADNDSLSVEIVSQPAVGYLGQNGYTGNWYYSAPMNFVGATTFTYRLFDGVEYSNVATATIQVTDTAPTAADFGPVTLLHGQSKEVNLRSHVADADGDWLSITIVSQPSNGNLWYNSYSDRWIYSPNSNYAGPDSFTFKASDGTLSSNVATYTFNVTNGVPTATDIGPLTLLHGRSKEVDLRSSVADPDNDWLSISIVSPPAHGSVSYNSYSDKWVYSPFGNYVGPDSFEFKASDGIAVSNVATVSLSVVNQAPIAANDGVFSVHRGQTLSNLNLTANDSDPDGDSFSVEIISQPAQGSVGQNNYSGTWYYSAPGNFVGTTTFTYRLFDGVAYSNVATATIQVTDTAPTATNIGPLTLLHGQSKEVDLRAHVADADGDSLSIVIVSQPSNGSLWYNSYSDRWIYSPASNYVGPDSFTFKANDGALSSNVATVTFDVTNQAPIAVNDDSFTVRHGQTLWNLNLTANDSDPDNDWLSVEIVSQPSQGTVGFSTYSGVWYYSAPNNFVGTTTFTYRLFDGIEYSSIATATIQVTDTAPTAADIGPLTLLHGQSKEVDLRSNVFDADGDSLSISIVSQPSNGNVWYNSYSDRWIYSPNSNYAGSDSFTFKANDGALSSNVATVTLNVTNQAPVAVNDGPLSVPSGQAIYNLPLKSNDSDPDGDWLTVSIITQPSVGSLVQNYGTGNWDYYAPSNYVGLVTFTYKVSDGITESASATVAINVTGYASGSIRFATSNYYVTEGPGAFATLVLERDVTTGTASVYYQTQDGTAVAGADFSAASGSVLFSDGSATALLTISLSNDQVFENPEQFKVLLSSPSNGYSLDSNLQSATVHIADDDQGSSGNLVRFASNLVLATEGPGAWVTLVAERNSTSGTASVDFYTQGASAAAGSDFVAATGTLAFADGSATALVTIALLNDQLYEPTETFSVVLSNPSSGYSVESGFGTASVQIADDDPAPLSKIRFATATYSVNEGAGIATIVLERDDASTTATVEYSSYDGTATASDYGPAFGTASFASGSLTASFSVTITDDTLQDGNEYLFLNLLNASSGFEVDSLSATATLNIIDDDPKNQAPAIVGPSSVSVAEDSDLVFSLEEGNAIVIGDPDAGSALVQLRLIASYGSLSLSTTSGLNFSFSDAHGTGEGTGQGDAVLTFRGTLAQINAALEGLLYQAPADFHGSVTLSLSVNDLGNSGFGGPLTQTKTIAITVNGAPVATADTFRVVMNLASTLDVLANDSDPDGNSLSISLLGNYDGYVAPSHGAVTVVEGKIRYQPADGYIGNDSFTYEILDGLGGRSSALVQVEVVPGQWATEVLDSPDSWRHQPYAWLAIQALGPANTTEYGDKRTAWSASGMDELEDGSRTSTLTLGFRVPEKSAGVVIRETFGNGFVTQIDLLDISGVWHPAVWLGTDDSPQGTPADFIVRWEPTEYATKDIRIHVAIDSDPNVWEEIDSVMLLNTIPVSFANAPILAQNIEAEGTQDTEATIPLNNSVSNSDGYPLFFSVSVQPSHGSAFVYTNGTPEYTNDDYVLYIPDLGFTGNDSLTYSVTDIWGNVVSALMTIEVQPTPDSPVEPINTGPTESMQTPIEPTGNANIPAPSIDAHWMETESPYFARNASEAKYRAWIQRPADATGASEVGDDVAYEFGVEPTMTWNQLFPAAEYQDLIAARTAAASALSPMMLARLDDMWRNAYWQPGYQDYNAVGEQAASLWGGVSAFSWVKPETGWHELYTVQAYVRLQTLRATPIPMLSIEGARQLVRDAVRDPNSYGMSSPATYLALSQPVRQNIGEALRQTVLPRLLYASSDEIAAYASLVKSDRYGRAQLRYAIDAEFSRLHGLLGGSPVDQAVAEANVAFAAYQRLYSELNSAGDSARYGIFGGEASGVSIGGFSTSSLLLFHYAPGTLEQRAQFLADTDYDSFRATEVQLVAAAFGVGPHSPEKEAQQAAAMNAIPSAEMYYAGRSLLLHTIQISRAQTEELLSGMLRLTTVTEPAGPLVVPLGPVSFPQTHRVIRPSLRPEAVAAFYVYHRYIKGANSPQTGTPLSDEAFYSIDRYSRANLGLSLLPSFTAASVAQQNQFADKLYPLDRTALLDSLRIGLASLRAAGDLANAAAAAQMIDVIYGRFNSNFAQAFHNALDPLSPARASAFQAYISAGANAVTPEILAIINSLPNDLKLLADSQRWQSFKEWRLSNPVTIRYDPVVGYRWVDNFLVNAADIVAPVYRTFWRGVSVITGSQYTDSTSAYGAIRNVINGRFDGPSVAATTLDTGWVGVTTDLGLTVLTLLPFGGAARATGVAGAGLTSAATRHLATLIGSGIASSLAMAVVDELPLSDSLREPLRFLAGMTVGIISGVAIQNRLDRLPKLVELAAQRSTVQSNLARVAREIEEAGAAVTQTLRDRQAALNGQLAMIDIHAARLRTVGGPELVRIEGEYAKRLRLVADFEAKIASPGLTPSMRNALRRDAGLRQLRTELAQWERDLAAQYRRVDQLVRANPLENCFPAGTPVAAEFGYKSIEDVTSQDRVWSFNFATQTWELNPVRELLRWAYEGDVVRLTLPEETIETTGNHPFWVIEGVALAERKLPEHVPVNEPSNREVPGRWVDARELLVGDVLLRKDAKPTRVESIEVRQDSLFVYNLNVGRLHNYAVGRGRVLVHNYGWDDLVHGLDDRLKNALATLENSTEEAFRNSLKTNIQATIDGSTIDFTGIAEGIRGRLQTAGTTIEAAVGQVLPNATAAERAMWTQITNRAANAKGSATALVADDFFGGARVLAEDQRRMVSHVEQFLGSFPPANGTAHPPGTAAKLAKELAELPANAGDLEFIAALQRAGTQANVLTAATARQLLVTASRSTPLPLIRQSGALRQLAMEVHDLAGTATNRIPVTQSTVSIVDVILQNGEREFFASGSGGYLLPRQIDRLVELGIKRENIFSGSAFYSGFTAAENHAERVLLRNLPSGATVSRWGISWGGRQRGVPCGVCRPFVEQAGGLVE